MLQAPILLTIHLAAINLQIPLTALVSPDFHIKGAVFPIELLYENKGGHMCINTNSSVFKSSFFRKKWIPIINNECINLQTIEELIKAGASAIVLVEPLKDSETIYDIDFPILSMTKNDYNFLINLVRNNIRNIGIPNDVTTTSLHIVNLLSDSIIADRYSPISLPVLIQIFLQLPPVLMIVLMAILWRSFSNDDENAVINYRYEDVPFFDYTKSRKISDNYLMCTICHEDFTSLDFVRVLECNHCFHKECISQWLACNVFCPLCRKNVGGSSANVMPDFDIDLFRDITYI